MCLKATTGISSTRVLLDSNRASKPGANQRAAPVTCWRSCGYYVFANRINEILSGPIR
ncbi:bsl0041 [Bradyrhizobium diazoefficiens USDA 110]|uniref:Bsl0041 protein n=2 Tax=Bradyrhizobium TaxID=374 RepID=Q89YB3_BRADU|nr:hypothetical protein CIT37_14600 [Bradyrhizobium ottawaense]MYV87945.1 hypothetical protein [Bradyrhizobium japonicum]NLS71408.1 hypothetical protein [Bradyrhizobium brasilense]NWL42653.1 hypothetical protein [Bradyrhizobium elkanii]QHP66156.1 hypothetical protein EI171_01165 [Bradyrhizobium sp. LCT2]QOZ14340.1 hypothetical protein XI02_04085 [Bradyrhizobium sp. CCBAU 21365]BAC45306.1 bsl0041 [Bradyrhizobium diazoefficiens USDA 110]